MAIGLSLAFVTFVDYPSEPSTPNASDLNRWQGNQVFFANVPAIVSRRTVNASIPHNTTTGIGFDVDDLDAENGHSPTSLNQEFTVRYSGWYALSAQVVWASPSGGAAGQGFRSVRISRRAVGTSADLHVPGGRVEQAALAAPNTSMGQQCNPPLVYLAIGEVVRVWALHTQGSTVTILEANFSMIWMRANG